MADMVFPLEGLGEPDLKQLDYALAFAGGDIASHRMADGSLEIMLEPGANPEDARARVLALLERYRGANPEAEAAVLFENRPEVGRFDVWEELLRRRWVTEVGDGHVVLRGLAARLLQVVDGIVLRDFVPAFQAEPEVYPATIRAQTLDRCAHFTSFPEHVDFVAHLRPDIEVLEGFVEDCRANGWSPGAHRDRMAEHDYAISPSCCYHAYEGMEGWTLDGEPRCITAVLNCHRYEAANQQSLRRLRSFHMREIIWVGHPGAVMGAREQAEGMLTDWALRWGLNCAFEAANDMFFTSDYTVKAKFQRQQAHKKELRALIPQDEGPDISIASSNFHATTFGRAFGITAKGRPAASGCMGWGLERWVYAVFSQFGFDPDAWPEGLREDFADILGS